MFRTPEGLHPTGVAIKDAQTFYVLAHPVGDGPVNADLTVVFVVVDGVARVVRVFPYEVTGIAFADGQLFVVDLEADMHSFDGVGWTDFTGSGQQCVRINTLRVIDSEPVGVGGDGFLYVWRAGAWSALTEETEDLYLYDVSKAWDGTIWVTSERGGLYTLEGRLLNRIPLDTNVDLTCVLPLGDGEFMVSGWKATFIIGSATQTRFIDPDGRTFAFLNFVRWNGDILVACGEDIGRLAIDVIERFSDHPAKRLHVGSGRLICHWEAGVAEYIEGDWRDIELEVDL
jgi:hypothetical protein